MWLESHFDKRMANIFRVAIVYYASSREGIRRGGEREGGKRMCFFNETKVPEMSRLKEKERKNSLS